MAFSFGGGYASIQTEKNPLTYFTIVAYDVNKSNLLSDIPKKEYFKDIYEKEDNFFDLTYLKKIITQIENIGFSSTITLDKKHKENVGIITFYLDGFKFAIDKLFSENISLYSEKKFQINIRNPIDPLNDFNLINMKLYQMSHDIRKYDVKFQHQNYTLAVECARLVSWYNHILDMIKNKYYLRKQFNKNRFLKFRTLKSYSIGSPSLEEYYSYYVGNSSMSFIENDKEINVELEIGKKINLCFICKVCSGVLIDDEIICVNKNKSNPLGTIIELNKQVCKPCYKKSYFNICKLKPQCNGYDEVCKDTNLINNICNIEYCIYFTIFDNIIKVGISEQNRIIKRLLEQGAYDALIYYPINNLPNAWDIEQKIVKYMNKYIEKFKLFGITSIKKEVSNKIKSNSIVKIINGDVNAVTRDLIYDKLREMMSEYPFEYHIMHKNIYLKKNWIYLNNLDVKNITYFEPENNVVFEGTINGIFGGYILIQDKLINITRLLGRVTIAL